MADFMDFEAVESSDEEQELYPSEKKKMSKRAKVVNESDEDDEDYEDRIREELKDMIDDNPIEESDGEDSGESGGSRKRKNRDVEDFNDRLDDDDYDLLEENLGVAVERKRFKRLRRVQESNEEDEQSEEGRNAIANELFDDDDERRSVISRRSIGRNEPETSDEEEGEDVESDYDDFIVDDDGQPIAAKKPTKKAIYSDPALQEAQDIFGVDFDYEEFGRFDEGGEEDEDKYVEENGEGEKEHRRKMTKRRPAKKTIFEIYEPSELKRGHFTDVDNKIRIADIPERMQLRVVPLTPVAEGSDELELEATWIYKQAFRRSTISIQDAHLTDEAKKRAQKGPQTVEKIRNALDLMRNQNFEVPFIAFYRKDDVQPELNINDLWKVYKYDAKWCQLQQRKQNLLSLFEKMRDYQLKEIMKKPDAPLSDDVRVIKDDDIERVKNVETNDELNDVHRHFMLYYSQDVPKMQQLSRKRAKESRHLATAEGNDAKPTPEDGIDENEDFIKHAIRSGPYAICRKAGLAGMAKRFGLNPEHFAENLRDNYQRHEVKQESIGPMTVALDYKNETFKTPEESTRAAQLMVAHQLAREPLVIKCVREMYMERAKLTVRPTKMGMKIIDEQHPIRSMKYLKDKPVCDLVGDEFLKLAIAEKDKLITMEFSDVIDGHTSVDYIEEIKQLYHRDEYSKHVQHWNVLRIGSVEMAMKKFVIPDLKKELRANLTTEALEYVMRSCCRKMHDWIKVAPYKCELADEEDEDWDTSKGIRVMGLSYVPDHSQAAFACVIKPNGEFGDYLRLPHILKRKNSFRQDEKKMKAADMLALRNFMATQKPHVVALAGESREAIMLAEDIRECVKTLNENEDFPVIRVEICDNDLAKIFANSNRGKDEFREYPETLREAISLARRLQDPLVEFSQMCTNDEEILCLKYNHYQDQLSKDELLENLYLEFVNRVNEVGVDLNKSVQIPYWQNLVQFVCGLGPRKGQALIKLMKQSGQKLENRTQLVTACHMGPKVFINCAGFVKIDTNGLGDSTEAYVEVLDGSRIHPETYEWARKMAVDALEYYDDEANPAGALEEILETPDKLGDLDLDAFAEELARQGFGNKRVTLYDIRSELNCRYKDLRARYQSPTPEKLFDMLTKETSESFYIGKLIMATVTGMSTRKPQGQQLDRAKPVRNDVTGFWQCPFCLREDFSQLCSVWNHFDGGDCPGKACGVKLRFDNGVSGFIHVKNVSDKRVDDLHARVYPGQSIHCRIIRVETDRFSVECTSKSSDLVDKDHRLRPPFDPFYDLEAQNEDSAIKENEAKTKQRQGYVKRVIVHPSFHNIDYSAAEKMLRSMSQGEAIIRPSSRGKDHLTATWKMTDDVLHHIDIVETDKANSFSLGKTLTIGNEKFEDLDEIIVRHINPMACFATELLDYKHYKSGVDGLKDKAMTILKEMKQKNMNSIPYIVSASKKYPGNFMLSYLPRVECKHEYISISPNGFRFRERAFTKVDDLFCWFKKHFRDPIPTRSTPSSATPGYNGVNQETIIRVAQNLPQHVLNSLSQVTSRTSVMHQYPMNGPESVAMAGYGGQAKYADTAYTHSALTSYTTPYQTSHHAQPPQTYIHQTSNEMNHKFVEPALPTPAAIYTRSTPSYVPTPIMRKSSPRSTKGTARNNDQRRTLRNGHHGGKNRQYS